MKERILNRVINDLTSTADTLTILAMSVKQEETKKDLVILASQCDDIINSLKRNYLTPKE